LCGIELKIIEFEKKLGKEIFIKEKIFYWVDLLFCG
jgi:hypothetical protein